LLSTLAIVVDAPPNSLKDSNASSKGENNTIRKSWGMFLNLQHFGVKKGVLEFQDGD